MNQQDAMTRGHASADEQSESDQQPVGGARVHTPAPSTPTGVEHQNDVEHVGGLSQGTDTGQPPDAAPLPGDATPLASAVPSVDLDSDSPEIVDSPQADSAPDRSDAGSASDCSDSSDSSDSSDAGGDPDSSDAVDPTVEGDGTVVDKDDAEAEGDSHGPDGAAARLEREGEVAADFLERLLDIADLDGDIDVDIDGDRAAVAIVDSDEGRVPRRLVGTDGKVLEALQELTRLAVQSATGERSRLMLDVAGHRATRRAELVRIAQAAIGTVRDQGERQALAPMTAFERKVVHDEVLSAGLTSESEGVEPQRFVVILPA